MLSQEMMIGSVCWELPRWLSGKASACKCGRPSSIPGFGRPLEEGMETHASILAWILETPMDRGAWRAAVHGAAQSQT